MCVVPGGLRRCVGWIPFFAPGGGLPVSSPAYAYSVERRLCVAPSRHMKFSYGIRHIQQACRCRHRTHIGFSIYDKNADVCIVISTPTPPTKMPIMSHSQKIRRTMFPPPDQELCAQLPRCGRVLPNKEIDGSGFFVALIRRKTKAEGGGSVERVRSGDHVIVKKYVLSITHKMMFTCIGAFQSLACIMQAALSMSEEDGGSFCMLFIYVVILFTVVFLPQAHDAIPAAGSGGRPR